MAKCDSAERYDRGDEPTPAWAEACDQADPHLIAELMRIALISSLGILVATLLKHHHVR